MEKQILKIIMEREHEYDTSVSLLDWKRNSAKEISDIFGRFMEWKELHSQFGKIENIDNLLYINFAEGSAKKYTLSELFVYWNEHINTKIEK